MIYLLRIPRTVAMVGSLLGAIALLGTFLAINMTYHAMTAPTWRVALARTGRFFDKAESVR